MAKSKQLSTGPKTREGKLRSSQNSIKHGLTSTIPSNDAEKVLVASYTKELVDYYDPQSPLEKLQIERIAVCRAKLAYLYELEQVKLNLALKELEAQPEKVLEKIPDASGVVRAMMIEFIAYGDIELPCKLNPDLLAEVCAEISDYQGPMDNPYQFARGLPKLTKYLNQFPVEGLNNSDQWLSKLASVAARLEEVLSLDKSYNGRWEEVIHYHFLGKKYESQLEREAANKGMNELDLYQEGVRKKHGLKPLGKKSTQEIKEGETLDLELIKKQLRVFSTLFGNYKKAKHLLLQYHQMQALLLRSVSLPSTESDLLMRYQTTLERRLSSAIGELLELQKRTPARN